MAAIRGIKITTILIAIFAALIIAGCGGGGGGNSLSYVPQNMARDCSNGPSAARAAAATATVGFDAVQCIQIHQYGQTTPVLKGATLTVSSGSSLMLQALVYDFQCSNVTSSFTGDISWSLSTSALGSLSMSQDTATLAAGTPASDVSGTITVMLFNGSTMVKQDSISVVVKASNTPSAPTGLAAAAGNTQVALTWTAPTTNTDSTSITDLAGYNVYYSTSSGGPYTQANASTVTGTNYAVTGLTNGTAYYFVVTAIDSESPVQESADSSEVNATPSAAVVATVPNAPGSVNATAGSAQATINWVAPATNTDTSSITDLAGYNVYYSSSSGGPYSQANVTLVAATNYTVTGLTNGVTYYFVVRAVDNESPANSSVDSAESIATPVAAATIPNAPTGLAAVAGDSQVSLTWTATTTNTDSSSILDLAGYNVYYSTASGGPYTQHNVATVVATNYTATGLTNGTAYYFVVQAIDNELPVNASSNSNESSATPTGVMFRQYFGDAGANYEAGSDVKQTSDGGYIMAGINVGGAVNVYKSDSAGAQQWTYSFPGNGQEVIETSGGDFIICGDDGAGTALLHSITSAGGFNWSQSYAGISHCYGILETGGTGFVFVGDNGNDGKLVFVGNTGVYASEQAYDHTGNTNEFIHSISTVSGGGYILGGYTGDGSTNDDFWLIRTDAAGVQTWENTYNNNVFDHAKNAFETATGFAIGGYSVDGGYTDSSMWLVFTDASGTQSGSFLFGQVGTNDYCYGLTKTSDNGFLLTGPSESPGTTGLEDFWLVKTDSSGTEQWNKFLGTTAYEFSNSVVQTSDGGYAVFGAGQNGGSYDFWLVKTDSSGNSP